ncbi:MAG: hypothetical protein CVT67_05550 [Actinobacteria bacterium HGW-Actinobacteria-7]|jgi:signal transduction histidine kinase|nr:MAG: hypothetical protein CVT67_05550 [Actinobacteria bacterium HGW-Actinobacteria-7]
MAEEIAAGIEEPSSAPQRKAWPSDVLSVWGRAFFARDDERHASQAELLGVLHDVADAVSTIVDLDHALDLIVQSARRITGTDKAIIVLVDEDSGGIDSDSVVVRGRKDQHTQEWWEHRLGQIVEQPELSAEPLLEAHPSQGAWLLCCPVVVKSSLVGLLCAVNDSSRAFTQVQQDSIAVLAAFAASSIETARLAEQARRVNLANERDRIARELHDGVIQSLFSISLGMEVCKKQIHRDPAAVSNRLDELQVHLNSAMTELRRFIYDLRPAKLVEFGLIGAVEFWVAEVTMGRTIWGRVEVEGALPRMSPSEEAVLYGVAKESVSNAVRHSRGQCVTVSIHGAPDAVRLAVVDDGVGFDVGRSIDGGATGLGLDSIRRRVEREGGHLGIQSEHGAGTRIEIQLPIGGIG